MSGAKSLVIIFLFLILAQQPSFAVEIRLSKSFYQPGETVDIEVLIWNDTSSKECLKSLNVYVSDSTKPLCVLTNNYPADTECVEAGEEKEYSFSCGIPLNAIEGVATIDVEVETWSSIHIKEKAFFEIGINYPPEIVLLSYPSVVNPSQEYSMSFSVHDNFGVEDLVSAEVALYHEVKTPERGYYLFTWEKPSVYTVWEADSPVYVDASLQPNEIVWTVTFSVSEIAAPGQWVLEITVYDAKHQHQKVLEHFAVTKYLSFSIQDDSRAPVARINFGRASPGEELPRVTLNVVVTSNSSVNIFVQADDLRSPEGAVLPVEVFYVESATGGRAQLSRSRQGVYFGYTQKGGFNQEARIILVFWGKLPEVVEAGTYSGIWYIVVEAV